MYRIACTSEHMLDGLILSCVLRLHHAGDHESFEGHRWPQRPLRTKGWH